MTRLGRLQPSLRHPVIEIMRFGCDFAWAMRPVSWVPMCANATDMNDRVRRHSNVLPFEGQRLRVGTYNLGNIDEGRHETKRFVNGGADHAMPDSIGICFIAPF